MKPRGEVLDLDAPAGVAQLVEHRSCKADVASSSLASGFPREPLYGAVFSVVSLLDREPISGWGNEWGNECFWGNVLMRRPCLKCGLLIPSGSYCRKHRKTMRGTTTTQAKFRRATLSTTGGRCARCGSMDSVQAHHDHPLAEGGHQLGPGTPLCRRCHKLAHR
jgi:hypothetical protein